jgi:hypothetical protein
LQALLKLRRQNLLLRKGLCLGEACHKTRS